MSSGNYVKTFGDLSYKVDSVIHALEAGHLRNFWMLVWGIRTVKNSLFSWESALGSANLHFATFMKICGDSLNYRKWPSKKDMDFLIHV